MCICFLNMYTIHFILDYIFYTHFVSESIVKFEIAYYSCSCVSNFLFLLYSLMMAINMPKHVAVDTVYSMCCVDRLFFGFIEILAVNSSYILLLYISSMCILPV